MCYIVKKSFFFEFVIIIIVVVFSPNEVEWCSAKKMAWYAYTHSSVARTKWDKCKFGTVRLCFRSFRTHASAGTSGIIHSSSNSSTSTTTSRILVVYLLPMLVLWCGVRRQAQGTGTHAYDDAHRHIPSR